MRKHFINGMAVLVILGFCTLVGVSLWIADKSRYVFGPTLLITDAQGHVLTNIGYILYQLDASGNMEQRLSLAELGIPDVPLTDGLVLPNGTLLVGVAGGRQLYACRLAERHCKVFLKTGNTPASAFKVTWDNKREHLILTDGERHRILTYDIHGNFIAQSNGGSKGLAFPNTVALTPQDELVIADTNHHRLVALDPETLGDERWELPVKNSLGNFRRIWPTDFIRTPDGNYWIILDDDLLKNGDVILFDEQRSPLRRLDLPADWDPVKLRVHGNAILLAGHGSVDLVRISADGEQITAFGDDAFRAELASMRAERAASQRWWKRWIWVCIVPLGLLAVITGYLDYRQRRQPSHTGESSDSTVDPPPLPSTPDGIYWIERNPVLVKQWGMAGRVIHLLPVLSFLMVALFIVIAGFENTGALIAIMLAFLVPLTAFMHTSLQIMSCGRLGVTRERLVLAGGEGRQQYAYPRQLVYNRGFISNGETTVFTRTSKAPIFREEDMSRFVLPLLQSARKLNVFQATVYLLQAGDKYTWINTVAIAYLTGLYIYLEFFY